MLFHWDELDSSYAPTFAPSLRTLDELRRRMERAFDDVDPATRTGALSLADHGTALELTAELPGVLESDVSLTLNKDVLTLGVRRTVTAPEGYKPLRQERQAFQATRNIALPARIDPERVRATLRDGVLTVRLEKAAESQPRRVTVTTV